MRGGEIRRSEEESGGQGASAGVARQECKDAGDPTAPPEQAQPNRWCNPGCGFDVPQSHAKTRALCTGDRVRHPLETIMTSTWSMRRLHAPDDAQIDELAGVLIDCVEGGASVSFMHPLTRDRALAFWRRVAQGVAAGERALLVAEDARGLCGTVQLVF